jgi:predicted aminopeptidase
LADVVNATGELSFERHEWWWPFVGRLPYKGFFDRDDATRLARRLERRGLDVWIRPVDAFSTLGVLRDPLYEFMTDYGPYAIANLMIHEQAHATLFLKGHAQFNEEFATFVGDFGALSYLHDTGASQAEIDAIAERAKDGARARQLIFGLRAELDALYRSEQDPDRMRAEKTQIIDRFRERVRSGYEQLFETDLYQHLAEIEINNAYIDLYVAYTQDLDLFTALYKRLDSSMYRFVEALKVLEDPASISDRSGRRLARRDPKAYIRERLLDNPNHASVE